MLTVYTIALLNLHGDADDDSNQIALLKQNDLQGLVIENTQ